MKFWQILTGALLGTQLTEAFTPLKPVIQIDIIKTLNDYRSEVKPKASNMEQVSYNATFQAELDSLVAFYGGRWFFENATNEYGQGVIRQGINLYYVPWRLGQGDTWEVAWHDTCSKLGNGCAIINLHYRASQASQCFDYGLCDATVYDRFKSCQTRLNEIGSGHPCSYAWVYWPNFIVANMKQVACVVLEVPGWMPPPGQLNSYVCYRNKLNLVSDEPYEAGEPCSECKPTQVCKSRLCA